MNPLDIKIESSDFDEVITLKEYFKKLLITLWNENEQFSGKRPFGNSGWQFDVYKALIKNELIEGELDEYGYIEEIDTILADKYITELIKKL